MIASDLKNLLERITAEESLVIHDGEVAYRRADLLEKIADYENALRLRGCKHSIVTLSADYSFPAIAMLLALWRLGNVVALVTKKNNDELSKLIRLCETSYVVEMRSSDAEREFDIVEENHVVSNASLLQLLKLGEPGFIIFSSGTTGIPKASLHKLRPLIEKFSGVSRNRKLKTISLLLFDHIGGLNTLLTVLSGGGELVCITDRTPDLVCASIQHYGVQAMVTSPTFLNLLLLSGALYRYDLSSLQVVNYGTEPMSEITLEVINKLLPNLRLSQAYGATEIGVIPTKSESSTSKWMKVGDSNCDVRIVNGLLEIKTKTSMIGYLNDENPFTEDGYYRTGDMALQRGEYIQVLGRQSDLINVGGEKFFPIEVESVLQQLDHVLDVCVSKIKDPIVGQVVSATFRLKYEERRDQFRRRLLEFCRDRLSLAKVPVKIFLTTEPLHGDRLKKLRLTSNRD